jgi:hypothetical protein
VNRLVAIFLLAVLLAIGIANHESRAAGAPMSPTLAAVTVPIAALNGSGQTGSATLTSTTDNRTQIAIALAGVPNASDEPAMLAPGTCPNVNAKASVALNDVVAGTSTTVVTATIAQLQSSPFAIAIHQSKTVAQPVACGSIPPPASGAMGMPATEGAPTPTMRP